MLYGNIILLDCGLLNIFEPLWDLFLSIILVGTSCGGSFYFSQLHYATTCLCSGEMFQCKLSIFAINAFDNAKDVISINDFNFRLSLFVLHIKCLVKYFFDPYLWSNRSEFRSHRWDNICQGSFYNYCFANRSVSGE